MNATVNCRRESWPGYSTYTMWQTLLSTSRKLGRDHAVLADLYSTQMSTKISELTDDVQRIYKKVFVLNSPAAILLFTLLLWFDEQFLRKLSASSILLSAWAVSVFTFTMRFTCGLEPRMQPQHFRKGLVSEPFL
jgi:hypothetical protein